MAVEEQGECRRQPWYKEKLATKYSKDSKTKQISSGSLNGSRWLFLEPAVDDFRDGYPHPSNGVSPHRLRGISPVIHNQKPVKRFTKEQAVFSKQIPLQQARRQYIDEIEYALTQHPLALFPHLEDGIESELFEEIVDILDPEMRMTSEAGSCLTPVEERSQECRTPLKEDQDKWSVKSRTRDSTTRRSMRSAESKPKNPYRWITSSAEYIKEDLTCMPGQTIAPLISESIKESTKDFCDWVKSLGGENYNIDETTIYSLFASGYETKPALSVPIHVVELNNVPAELRRSVGVPDPPTVFKTLPRGGEPWQPKVPTYLPSWVKIRYGAWYLDPRSWKKQRATEPLLDPNVDFDPRSQESRLRINKLDAELVELHGTESFKNFIERKGYRTPEFLAKILAKKEAMRLEQQTSKAAREGSSKESSWYRPGSASTQEESLVN